MPASVECLNASCSAEENWPAPEATRHVDVFFIAALSKEQEKVRSIMKRLKVHLFVCVVGAVLIPLLLAPTVAQAAAWTVVSSPNPGAGNGLLAVAAGSPTDVWSVGDSHTTSFQTLTQHWDGHKWSVVSSPNPGAQFNELFGVAAVSTTDVWAVGSFAPQGFSPSQTLIEHWNGTTWSVVTSPNPSSTTNLLEAAAAD